MTSTSTARPPALVVGTGFGCRIHVPALRAAGFDVAGLVGTKADRTTRRAEAVGVKQAFTDLDEAIAQTHAKVVTIATPPHTHKALALTAISHGCHVVCEKPFAMDVAEGRAMLQAAEKSAVVHLVGHEFRWLPDRAMMARAIVDGLIGEPRMVILAQYSSLVASPEAKMPAWWFDEKAGGGWLGAQGSHVIDQVRCWLGDFASLSASLPMVSERKGGAEDSYALSFTLANGVQGILQQTAGAWGPAASMARIAGTRGTLWTEAGCVKIADREGTRDLPIPPEFQLPPVVPSDDPRLKFSQFELGPYTRLCEALRSAMEGDRSSAAVPLPTFTDGVASMVVLDAIRASAASGGALMTLR